MLIEVMNEKCIFAENKGFIIKSYCYAEQGHCEILAG